MPSTTQSNFSLCVWCCFLFVFFLSSCGPRVRISPSKESPALSPIAFLPIAYPSGVRKEKVDTLRAATLAELRNSGFYVLEDAIVTSICSSPSCPEKTKLKKDFGVQSFASLDIESAARNNFLAGYYNAISGKLLISDSESEPVFRVDHTESERGGILFHSGQIIQGVISQLENSAEEESFGRLASKFARAVVSKAPSPQPLSSASEEPKIVQIDTKLIKPTLYELCVTANPGSLASLITSGSTFNGANLERAQLRETRPGYYCSTYRLDDFRNELGPFFVEVKSPFGLSSRKEIKLADTTPCSLKNKVKLVQENNSLQILIECPTGTKPLQQSQALGQGAEACSDFQNTKKGTRFIIYKAPSQVGPFEKIAETTKFVWGDMIHGGSKSPSYQVVCVDALGLRSLPEPAQPPKRAKA